MRVAALFVLACVPSVAAAQSDLARAQAAMDRAEFAEAIEAYDAAANGDSLSRADVLALLEGRAIARHASRDVAGAEADLGALLSLEPEAPLGEAAPPALQRSFGRLRGEIRGRLAIASEASRIPDGFAVRARVTDDVASLVREVRVRWEHDGEWRTELGREVNVPSGARIRWYVEAIGPGGAVIASDGTEREPHEQGAIEAPIEEPMPAVRDDTGLHVAIAIGIGVVLAAVAVVLAVVLTMPERTQPSPPMERP